MISKSTIKQIENIHLEALRKVSDNLTLLIQKDAIECFEAVHGIKIKGANLFFNSPDFIRLGLDKVLSEIIGPEKYSDGYIHWFKENRIEVYDLIKNELVLLSCEGLDLVWLIIFEEIKSKTNFLDGYIDRINPTALHTDGIEDEADVVCIAIESRLVLKALWLVKAGFLIDRFNGGFTSVFALKSNSFKYWKIWSMARMNFLDNLEGGNLINHCSLFFSDLDEVEIVKEVILEIKSCYENLDFNALDCFGNYSICSAVEYGNEKYAEFLIDFGCFDYLSETKKEEIIKTAQNKKLWGFLGKLNSLKEQKEINKIFKNESIRRVIKEKKL